MDLISPQRSARPSPRLVGRCQADVISLLKSDLRGPGTRKGTRGHLNRVQICASRTRQALILSHRALASRAIALPASWTDATHRLPGQATPALFKGRHTTRQWDVLPSYLSQSASRASRAARCDPASPHAQARSPTWTGHARSEPAAFNTKCSDRGSPAPSFLTRTHSWPQCHSPPSRADLARDGHLDEHPHHVGR